MSDFGADLIFPYFNLTQNINLNKSQKIVNLNESTKNQPHFNQMFSSSSWAISFELCWFVKFMISSIMAILVSAFSPESSTSSIIPYLLLNSLFRSTSFLYLISKLPPFDSSFLPTRVGDFERSCLLGFVSTKGILLVGTIDVFFCGTSVFDGPMI
jgi:hypothetical protein